MKGILTKHIPLNAEAERSLHTVISEMEPDIALLCCANIAREIYAYEKTRELDDQKTGPQIVTRSHGAAPVKGRTGKVKVFELLSLDGTAAEEPGEDEHAAAG